MEPSEILASAEVLKIIDSVSRRKCAHENEAHECYLFILDGMKDQDYARLRCFKGGCTLNTYIHTVCHSLANSYLRHKFGRRYIPKAIERMGEWARRVYELVCWKKLSFNEAYDLLRINGLLEMGLEVYYQEIEPIRQAPCRENPHFTSMDDTETTSDIPETGQPNPLEALLEKLAHERRIKAGQVIQEVMREMSSENQLLIRFIFLDNMTQAAAAGALNMPKRTVSDRLKKLLLGFRERLLAEGIREA